jgi:hypothetical protein
MNVMWELSLNMNDFIFIFHVSQTDAFCHYFAIVVIVTYHKPIVGRNFDGGVDL